MAGNPSIERQTQVSLGLPLMSNIMFQGATMAANNASTYETNALKCFIDSLESEAIAKRCKFCRAIWLSIAIACGIFVYIAYNYTSIGVPFLLIASMVGGSFATLSGISSGNAKNTEILKPYVNIEAMKERMRELET